MPKQTLVFENPVQLSLNQSQLCISYKDSPATGRTRREQHDFRLQLEASEPTKKQMWKNVVKTKIRNQAQLLETLGRNSNKLSRYVNSVRSGDTTNCEGHAAQIYWKELMGKGFIRDRFGEYPNSKEPFREQMVQLGTSLTYTAASVAKFFAGETKALATKHRLII